jgi:hypothetical protein
MKKSILIVVVVMGFGILSCEKHDCSKNSPEAEAPTWRSAKVNRDGEAGGHGGPVVNTGGSITDPNDDEDGNGRKKKR